MNSPILAPAAILILWSLIMLLWMAAVRFPALKKSGVMKEGKPGGRGSDLDGVLPDNVQWKAHNYNNLMEQPTVFYTLVLVIALTGATALDVWLAWAYVALRVAHSLWQALVNTVPVRLLIFTAGSFILLFMAARTVLVTLG